MPGRLDPLTTWHCSYFAEIVNTRYLTFVIIVADSIA